VRLPFRLRSVLIIGMAAGFVWTAQPRAAAAWKLHATAVNLANYALCMVGPTGPALLRDGSPQFKTLVRRRLVSSEPTERPFQDCAKLALELTASADAERAHRAPAWSFVEYGGDGGDGGASLTTEALGVNGRGLGQLAREAWPFVRSGYVKLVKPSISAKEAVHPIESARPGVGRGLPAWRAGYRSVGEVDGALVVAFGRAANLAVFRSADGGISWRPAPLRSAEAFAERCSAGDRSYTFSLGDTGAMRVSSHGQDGTSPSVPLSAGDSELLSAACDEKAVVAVLKTDRARNVSLVQCGFRGTCRPLELPGFPGGRKAESYPLDVARLQGTTVVAATMRGIVRVTSSRDDGRTWTPFTVAYDDGAHPDVRVDVRVPTRLLSVGKHVFLYGGAPKPGQTYSLLVSEDLGASWRTPDVPSPAVAAVE